MNVYLFSAGVTLSQAGKSFGSDPLAGQIGYVNRVRTWDQCFDLIVGGDSPGHAQQRFESWLKVQEKDGMLMEVQKMVAAQFLTQQLAEPGSAEVDWPKICQEAEAQLEAASADDSEQGYWVDVNEFVPTGKTFANVEALQGEMPEDVRSGLNWSPKKTFLFVVSILSPLPDLAGKSEDSTMQEDAENENNDGAGETNPDDSLMALPELADKAAAILIEARNSVVAAWLWQKFAAATPLAGHRIQLGSWCQAIGIKKE